MIPSKNEKNFNLLINLVFGFFPISFIFGNFFTNANLAIFCILGIYCLKSKILEAKFNFIIKVIFLLFFIIIFSTSIGFIKSIYFEEYQYYNLERLIKSVTFLRYFLMLIIIYLLSEYEILNFKYFLFSAAFFPAFISLDIIYQHISGFNIIGLENTNARLNSSFFGDEFIAGSYIQNFSFFSILLVFFIFQNKKNINFFLSTATIGILGLGILLAGNRMPLVLFILGLFLLFFFTNKFKKIILSNILILFFTFGFVSSIDDGVKYNFRTFYGGLKKIVSSELINFSDKKSTISSKNESQDLTDDFESFWFGGKLGVDNLQGHSEIFLTAIDTWKKNKIFGNGIKSFREDCIKIKKHKENRACSNHPHNYYLEILTEIGIVGLFIVTSLALIFIIFVFKNYKIFRKNFILTASIISLFLATFPLKSTGSIFTTSNATYLILIASIIISYKKILHISNFD